MYLPWSTTAYTDPLITGAKFSEHDGIAELDITGTAPLMANFADGGKTIIVTAAPPPATTTVAQLPIRAAECSAAQSPSRRRAPAGHASWS